VHKAAMTTVLVIDDETINAEALAYLLAGEGMNVLTATDGKAGLRLIAQCRPDVIVTDFMMPIMTGLELAQTLRSDPDTDDAAIPLLLLTAAQADIGRRYPDMFDVVLEKPCQPKDFVAAAQRLVQGRGRAAADGS